MLILGIETSCDETGVALLDNRHGLLAQALHSQIDLHRAYGGVVPELASRDHIRRVLPLTDQVLAEAGKSRVDVDAIAVTEGPGLAGALLVGTSVAHAIGFALGKPVVGVHHLEGHLLSPLLAAPRPEFPFVALLVSGGHTQLLRVDALGQYQLLGETLDDAAGEAFDKTAQLLGLPYPGGPAVSKLAESGQARAVELPRPMLKSGDLDFSFSGLKTAVLTAVRRAGDAMTEQLRADIARAFVDAVVDVLSTKAMRALDQTRMKTLVVAGGVGANVQLRTRLQAEVAKRGAAVHFPPLHLCTDNGAMIAAAGLARLQRLD
ncbi:MAG: tRNA (adenosine(37)-N6)-threonylcarbamoyltransferase complex transferase subunit TsaD, partial [Burkholderiaceae bacterium]